MRLGIPEDYARELLDDTLPQFMARHPGILLDVTTDTSGRLARGLRARRLDLAVVLDHAAGLEGGETLWHPTPVWAGPAQGALHQEAIVPLAVHPAECPYRQLASDALDAAQRPWGRRSSPAPAFTRWRRRSRLAWRSGCSTANG
ncbi:LysR substrate-binding domain-containing protein [Salinicola tamaricis]|uniref:LysR substrate-binding domain-containing protein n=1 Tax=Salinicola tamaricis TaxID=1771309 RepID=UPI001F5D16B5|nr:LysR substrate-binding domain-containing protein [Salinicola tamaricis]